MQVLSMRPEPVYGEPVHLSPIVPNLVAVSPKVHWGQGPHLTVKGDRAQHDHLLQCFSIIVCHAPPRRLTFFRDPPKLKYY